MTKKEAEAYFEKLTASQAWRFNSLVQVGLKLGKPIEGAYEYAKTIMELPETLPEEEAKGSRPHDGLPTSSGVKADPMPILDSITEEKK